MKIFPGRRQRQRGAALLALAAILVLGISWMMVTALGTASQRTTSNREHNARVLSEAKAALVGWVAANALNATNNNPGRLPCPEAINNVGTAVEGVSAPWIGPPATPTCSLVGRLPWRTLGLSKLRDATGEPLWYVVSPGWALSISTTLLSINSNSRGQLVVDGQPAPNEIVALIIAPGQAMNVEAAVGCTPRAQIRTTPSPGLDARDYIECFDAGASPPAFFTLGPGGSFNDQVLKVTTADILPVLEAAVAKRIERDIVPVLKTVYAPAAWGFGGANPVYPFAAPFENPGPGVGTSKFQGQGLNTPLPSTPAAFQGLLPFNQVQNCIADPANPRCLLGAALIDWAAGSPSSYKSGGSGDLETQTCQWEAGNVARVCQGKYTEDSTNPSLPGMRIEMQVTLNNVAMGLRAIDATRMQIDASTEVPTTWLAQAVSRAATMNADGSATIRFWADLPNIDSMGWGNKGSFRIRIERMVITDHPLLDPASATTGWFVRNEWYRLLYYATASGHTTAPLPAAPSCTTGTNCISVANMMPDGGQRAILILAGRSINGSMRPSAALSDYLEQGNAAGAFVLQPVSRASSFNDRVIVVDANP